MSEEAKQKAPSVFDGCKYIMAEQIKGKKVGRLTIKSFVPCVITGESGRTANGFEVGFAETEKLVCFACKDNRKRLVTIFGTEDYRQYIGKAVGLTTTPTGKGEGVRFIAATPAPQTGGAA
jgi:hypothetical protein